MVLGTAGLAQASSSLNIVEGTAVSVPPASGSFAGSAVATAACPEGQVLTGGGANVRAGNSYLQNYQLVSSIPIGGQRWWAFATNMDSGTPGTVTAYAICAKVTDVSAVTAP